jgi:hypothetical protein
MEGNMNKWKYTIDGKKFNQLLDRQDTQKNCAKVVIELIRMTKECFDLLPTENWYKRGFEELYYLLDGDDELCMIENEDLKEYGFSNRSQLLNDRFEEFYNLCDCTNIWIKK